MVDFEKAIEASGIPLDHFYNWGGGVYVAPVPTSDGKCWLSSCQFALERTLPESFTWVQEENRTEPPGVKRYHLVKEFSPDISTEDLAKLMMEAEEEFNEQLETINV